MRTDASRDCRRPPVRAAGCAASAGRECSAPLSAGEAMTTAHHQPHTARAAIVLRPTEQRCDVHFGGETAWVEYGIPFSPRAKTLTPGHLVAVTDRSEATSLIIWRWYDAVVLEQSGDEIRLWEPSHGEVQARSRKAHHRYAVGTRAYASAGLPGADWWVEGPAAAVEDADVAMDQVFEFYAAHGLWSRLP